MSITFVFRNVSKSPLCKFNFTDPQAIYMIALSTPGEQGYTMSGEFYKDIKPLLASFDIKHPYELTGQSFVVPDAYDDPFLALNHAVTVARNGGLYVRPTSKQLYDLVVNALAQMEQPDFLLFDNLSIWRAFSEVFEGYRAKASWLAWLQSEVYKRSKGTVTLMPAEREEFRYTAKGPAEYLKLVQGDRVLLVMLGPYSSPVDIFDPNDC